MAEADFRGKVIDGTAFAAGVRADVTRRVLDHKQQGRGVHLTALLVGHTPAGELYAARQRASCEEVGISYELRLLPSETSAKQLSTIIASLNRDPSVTGIMLHLPLPSHLDATEMQYQIDPVKDV